MARMPEPFKTLLNTPLVHAAALHLVRVWPAFAARRFVALATHELEALELKARALQISDALSATLPADFFHAADVLEEALGPPASGEQAASLQITEAGLAGWVLWSVGEFVAQRGLDHPERALRLLHAITQRFTAEFAIRPFLIAHEALTLRTLAAWVHDPSAHVRRLVSEGSRPRLPWGVQLKAFVADPSPTLPLLRALQDDPSAYVRRSVANHLNDIAKDHPAVVTAWVETQLPAAGPARRAMLRHASRTLIKRGDARMLRAWGVGHHFAGSLSLSVSPAQVRVGDMVALTVQLQAAAHGDPQLLEIDYVVHHVKANGGTTPKVFKGWRCTLAPGEARTLVKRHSLRAVTTRCYHAGEHRVVVQVNGVFSAETDFVLTL
jgi:3-methyladenine DNA glycosylase AlkC